MIRVYFSEVGLCAGEDAGEDIETEARNGTGGLACLGYSAEAVGSALPEIRRANLWLVAGVSVYSHWLFICHPDCQNNRGY